MKNRILLSIISLAVLGACVKFDKNNTSQVEGFSNINDELHNWTSGLNNNVCLTNIVMSAESIIALANSNENVHKFYLSLIKNQTNCQTKDFIYYKTLATNMLIAKKELRKNNAKFQEHSNLLSQLLEETLYLYSYRSQDTGLFKVYFNNNPTNCLKQGQLGGKLSDLNICQGDVILSKGPSSSSSLLSEILDFQGSFSHATLAQVDNNKKVNFIESYIEDGAKIRRSNEYYDDVGMAKLYLYRFNSSKFDIAEHNKLISNSVDQMVVLMNERTGGKAFDKAAWPYDPSVDADNFEKLYCTEVPIYAYHNLPMPDEVKPFAKSLWNTVNPSIKSFSKAILSLDLHKIPAPSDLDRNDNFDIDAVVYDLEKLQRDRAYVALMNATIDVLNDNSSLLNPFFDFIGYFKDVSKESFLEKLTFIGKYMPIEFINKNIIDVLKAQIDQNVPNEIGLRQVAFMVLYNQIIGPTAMQLVLDSEKAAGKPLTKTELKQILRVNLATAILPDYMKKFDKLNWFISYLK